MDRGLVNIFIILFYQLLSSRVFPCCVILNTRSCFTFRMLSIRSAKEHVDETFREGFQGVRGPQEQHNGAETEITDADARGEQYLWGGG